MLTAMPSAQIYLNFSRENFQPPFFCSFVRKTWGPPVPTAMPSAQPLPYGTRQGCVDGNAVGTGCAQFFFFVQLAVYIDSNAK
jgi:hypothetical protein